MKVGILGAGQLGRMIALAGVPLGFSFRFLDPNPESPARELGEFLNGPYDDADLLAQFTAGLDVATYEFESVPAAAAEKVSAAVPLRPGVRALATAQDRLAEKSCFQHLGIRTAPFAPVDSQADLEAAAGELGYPSVLKTRRLGYDGKGQRVLESPEDLDGAWEHFGAVPLMLERFVEFSRELSIISVRSLRGETAHYPLVENHHSDGILRASFAPAGVSEATERLARGYAERVLDALEYVGVLAIELFEAGPALIANEMAPRVHNSGHWTIEGANTSQFENHLRAITGMPLGDTSAPGFSAMLNVIGHEPDMSFLPESDGVHVHSYGKKPKQKRKLGHVTICGQDVDAVMPRVTQLRSALAPRALT